MPLRSKVTNPSDLEYILLCRAWLVLEEKQIPYEWKDIALQDENGVPLLERKKDIYPELYQLNPHGKG